MRLFAAIDIPDDLLLRLERLISAWRGEALIKWSPVNNLHITTKFVGEWEENRLQEIHSALRNMKRRPPFNLTIQGFGWFPNGRAPRVLWSGVAKSDPLNALAAETEETLARLGISREARAFSPHLTLARVLHPVPLERLRQKVAELHELEVGAFTVSRFFLYQSQTGSNASRYRKLQQYEFESAAVASQV